MLENDENEDKRYYCKFLIAFLFIFIILIFKKPQSIVKRLPFCLNQLAFI